jgi:hypothetical protein
MNWHEYYSLLLSGRPVVDWSDAGTWATYDVKSGTWSPERIARAGVEPSLPEVSPTVRPSARSCRRLPRWACAGDVDRDQPPTRCRVGGSASSIRRIRLPAAPGTFNTLISVLAVSCVTE